MHTFFRHRLHFVALVGAVPSLAACNAEVVQTATLVPNPLDCSTPALPSLPSDDVFGEGTEPLSSLVGAGYEAGEGPGLFVTARDAFRVYLDGALVVEGAEARRPLFIPLTLLPGTNVVSVVVAASVGTPVALIHLDELSRSYTSGVDWKVSTAPEAGFGAADFDDTAWPQANDYGALGSLPGCDPEAGFAASSDAHWIGPSGNSSGTAVLRKVIRIAPIGYGAGSEGGSGAPVLVDSWEGLEGLASEPDEPAIILLGEGTHDFREESREQLACPSPCPNSPEHTQYRVLVGDETCETELVARSRSERRLDIGSNKTIVGLGRGAHVRGVSFNLESSQNVIVRNLALYDINPELVEAGDAFSLGTVNRIWLDHCTTKWISDDFTGVVGGRDVTLSWLRYDGVTSGECQGQHTRAANFSDATLTIHHSFFDHVQSQSPRVEGAGAHVHVLQNLLSDNPSYAVAAACGAQVLLEGNTFQRVATPTSRTTCVDDDPTVGLVSAPAGSNRYDADVGEHEGGDGLEPRDDVPAPPYSYTIADPTEAELAVRTRAGAGGPWRLPLELD